MQKTNMGIIYAHSSVYQLEEFRIKLIPQRFNDIYC